MGRNHASFISPKVPCFACCIHFWTIILIYLDNFCCKNIYGMRWLEMIPRPLLLPKYIRHNFNLCATEKDIVPGQFNFLTVIFTYHDKFSHYCKKNITKKAQILNTPIHKPPVHEENKNEPHGLRKENVFEHFTTL